MKLFIKMIAPLLVIFMYTGSAWALDCEVTAYENFFAGEMLDGTASDLSGTETIHWVHDNDAMDIHFETNAVDPDGIMCRRGDDGLNDTFIGTGIATVNGDPGYSFYIYIQDNRGPSDINVASASIDYRPTTRGNFMENYATPRPVVIPAEFDVISGDSGNGKVEFWLDGVKCKYYGTGPTYAYEECDDPGYGPGDILDVTMVLLRIQQSEWFVPTVVQADIGTGYPPGVQDVYQIEIFDSTGASFYSFSGLVENGGDISITLPGSP